MVATALPFFARPLSTVSPRDLLLWEHLPTSKSDTVLEIGVGTGSSLIRLAPRVHEIHGADVAEGAVQRLKVAIGRQNGRLVNADVFLQDFCSPLPHDLEHRYDVIFSCDTVEHVVNPSDFFKNVYRAMKPGGRALITFPNESSVQPHGITWFDDRATLMRLLVDAGFRHDDVEMSQVSMRAAPAAVLEVAWWMPRRIAKSMLRTFRSTASQTPPQVFDDTDLYRLSTRLDPIAPAINLYCWLVMAAMTLTGPVYRLQPLPSLIADRQVLIRLVRACD
jgi:SAM-dependent methyltransferase